MKRFIAIGCIGVFGFLCLVIALKDRAKAAGPAVAAANPFPATPLQEGLIVHEWGTFTGLAGADGVHLPFNTLVGSDLPFFVMNRMKHGIPDDELSAQLLFVKGGGAAALQRMETPVIYFYADAPRDVDVRVDFPSGLLTEFYPSVRSMGPSYGAAFGEVALAKPATPGAIAPQTKPTAIEPGTNSFLDWGRVRIVPHPTGDEGKLVPAVTDNSHYRFARDTDSALVQFETKGRKQEEKFLFYRGLGNFKLPVKLTATGGDRFEFRNAGPSPVGWAFLIQVGAQGTPPRFARFENLSLDQDLVLPPGSGSQASLSEAITASLVSSGLYEKEARAMVQTWKANWLEEPGTRVLYVVPRPVTDRLLPLRVAPTPEQLVRALVGRIDILTPETESRLLAMIRSANESTRLSDTDVRLLSGLGRFLTPALEHVNNLKGDDAAHQANRLQALLSKLSASRN